MWPEPIRVITTNPTNLGLSFDPSTVHLKVSNLLLC